MPSQDRERMYGMKEKNIAKLITLCLGKIQISQIKGLQSSESERLKNFKNPNFQPYGAPVGDFPQVLHSVIQGFQRKDTVITVGELNYLLDELAKAQGSAVKDIEK